MYITSRAERVYRWLPRPIQDLALTAKSIQISRSRYGGDFPEILADYEHRNTWGPAEMEAYRLAMLQVTVRDAAKNVPHYATAAYSGLNEIESLDDLAAFPVLSKVDVRELGDRLHSTSDLGPLRTGRTSGTTGSPLAVPATTRADWEKWAVWWRYRRWHGIDRREWSAVFGSKPIARSGGRSWRMDRGQRRLLLSSYHTSPAALDESIDAIQGHSIRWVHGFPSVIALLAERAIERQMQGQLAVRWVTFGGETVLDRHRNLTAVAFGVTPRQHYGAAEMVANVSECPRGALHVDEDFSILEVLDGQMVGTCTINPAFPLIRYQTGDTAVVATHGCDCGLPGRIISSLDGRTDDYLVLADGSRLGRLSAVMKALEDLSSAQFIQSRPGHAELHVVAARPLSDPELAAVGHHIEVHAPGGIDLEVRQVSELTRSRAGKIRLVIQDLQSGPA